jgi:signal transduction histidine kinase
MALDSGIQQRVRRQRELDFVIQYALAYSQNMPLRFVDASLVGRDHLASYDPPPNFYDGDPLEQFWKTAPPHAVKWDRFEERISASGHFLPSSYVNPFYRLLLDSWTFRWFDMSSILRGLEAFRDDESKSRIVHLQVGSLTLESAIAFVPNLDTYLIGGPIVHDPGSPNFSADDEDKQMESLESLENWLKGSWKLIAENMGRNPASDVTLLHSADFLHRFLFSRQRGNMKQIEARLADAAAIYKAVLDTPSHYRARLPAHSVSKIVASALAVRQVSYVKKLATSGADISAHNRVSISMLGTTGSMGAALVDAKIESTANPALKIRIYQTPEEAPPETGGEFEAQRRDRISDESFTCWQLHKYESFIILRNWLNSQFGLLPREDSGANDDAIRRDQDRLARFIARIFLANEVTIYRAAYGDPKPPLLRFGAFSDAEHEPEKKLDNMQRHMARIAQVEKERKESISYRALDTNTARYVKYFDLKTGKYEPEDERISAPESSGWGSSTVAVPIRVNGLVWGVLELVSNRPDNFPLTVRAKIVETTTLLSSSLFVHSIIRIISTIADIVFRSGEDVNHKAGLVCQRLQELFLAETVAIIHFGPKPDRGDRPTVFGHAGRDDLADAAAANATETGAIDPFVRLAKHSDEFWTASIGDDDFLKRFGQAGRSNFYTSRKDSIIATFLLGGKKLGMSPTGVLCVTFPKQTRKEERWERLYLFLAQYISVVIEALLSDTVWNKGVRHDVSHELRRIVQTLGEATTTLTERLEGAIKSRNGLPESLMNELHNPLYDIQLSSQGMGYYVEVLKGAIDGQSGSGDVRLQAMRVEINRHRDNGSPNIDIRQPLNSALRARRHEMNRRLLRVVDNLTKPLRVQIPEWCAQEIFAILADNAIKYATAGTDIVYSSRERPGGGLSITIQNLGPALHDEDKERIFRPGYRGSYARQYLERSGEGKGLSFARSSIRLMNGELYYSSKAPDTSLPPQNGYKVVWHLFTLVFDPDTVVKSSIQGN